MPAGAGRDPPGAAARGGPRPRRHRRSLRQQRRARHADVPAGRAGRRGQQRPHGGADGRGEPGGLRPGHLEVRPRVRRAGRREDLESGEAQADAGRQGDGRHGLRRHRRRHLLRDGERRLRLHLDRDAARPARLGGGRAHVADLPARESGARRARRLRRRARDPARARRRRARDRRADGRHRGRGDRGAQLDLLPAARPAQQRRRAGLRLRRCGAACPAATATPSTTTSC